MSAYYNEHDRAKAAWLRELVSAGLIAPGEVDERDIKDVRPDDLREFEQCHFFAGIGVWSYALRQAGWPDDRPVWTGSCPCQSFSAAGSRKGFDDERHLWPALFHLLTECRPVNVFGEQVASKDGLAWLDLIQADLEGAGYACGAVDSCAAGFGAPHIRQRLYFAAERLDHPAGSRHIGSVTGPEGNPRDEARLRLPSPGSGIGGLADNHGRNASPEGLQRGGQHGQQPQDSGSSVEIGTAGPTNGFWRDADWLGCRDDKWRPVKPGTFPLVNGASCRVGLLRGYGDAIVAPQAAAFVQAYLELRS